MSTAYGSEFAQYYDALYQDRDVNHACRLVTDLVGAAGTVRERFRLLDFGCGTGAHALQLWRRGWEVVGVDSAPAMAAAAQAKCPPGSRHLQFLCGDLPALAAELRPCSFDGAIALFNVFNCLPTAAEMRRYLHALRALLRDGGRLLADLWNGAAVDHDQPQVKVKQVRVPAQPHTRLTQTLTPTLHRKRRQCLLHYHVEVHDADTDRHWTFEDTQAVHFLTPQSYQALFHSAGFKVLSEFPVGRPGTPLTGQHWFVSYLLEASAHGDADQQAAPRHSN